MQLRPVCGVPALSLRDREHRRAPPYVRPLRISASFHLILNVFNMDRTRGIRAPGERLSTICCVRDSTASRMRAKQRRSCLPRLRKPWRERLRSSPDRRRKRSHFRRITCKAGVCLKRAIRFIPIRGQRNGRSGIKARNRRCGHGGNLPYGLGKRCGETADISKTGDAPLPPRLPSEASANVSWQVFGLTGSTYLSDFPGASPSVASTFVPAYRCGAVPDSHRIPLFTLAHERPRNVVTISCGLVECKPDSL